MPNRWLLLVALVLTGCCPTKAPFQKLKFTGDPAVLQAAKATQDATRFNESDVALMVASRQAKPDHPDVTFAAAWLEGQWLMAAVDVPPGLDRIGIVEPPAGTNGPRIAFFRRLLEGDDDDDLEDLAKTALRWKAVKANGVSQPDLVVLYAFLKGNAKTVKVAKRADDLVAIGADERKIIVYDTHRDVVLREQGKYTAWLLELRREIRAELNRPPGSPGGARWTSADPMSVSP